MEKTYKIPLSVELPTWETIGYDPYLEKIAEILKRSAFSFSATDFSSMIEGISSGLIKFDFTKGRIIISDGQTDRILIGFDEEGGF